MEAVRSWLNAAVGNVRLSDGELADRADYDIYGD